MEDLDEIEDEDTDIYSQILSIASKYPQLSPRSFKPFIVTSFGIACHVLTLYYLDKKLAPDFKMNALPKHAYFLLWYWLVTFTARIHETKTTSVIYESLWGCNIGIITTGIGCYLGKPLFLGISMSLLGVDQATYWIDAISYLFTKKCIIGSASYMCDPNNTTLRRITSLHHLWFLPYSFYLLYKNKSYLHKNTFYGACAVGTILSILGRILTNKFIWMPITPSIRANLDKYGSKSRLKKGCDVSSSQMLSMVENKNSDYYLEYSNINCGYEVPWHIKLPILHYCDKRNVLIHLTYLSITMNLVNYVPYWVMKKISDRYLKPRAVVYSVDSYLNALHS
eukprot:181484_1